VISIEFYLGSQTRLILAVILTEGIWKNCFRRHAIWSQRDVDMKNDYAHRHPHPREPQTTYCANSCPTLSQTASYRSETFEKQMKCYNDHFKVACELFGESACNSGSQTFEEDVEGLFIAYELLFKSYDDEELEKVIFKSDSLSVNRKQAFFYLKLRNITMMYIPIIKCVLMEI
ncbi:hypothetical protein PRIPAC_97418, partial [Pristionchus pacificus]|uniref:Uncharacterized protein n=1 Tax=Pristionchus pacificus TaxID=54126 RepID=A0A2A6BCC9_PRIPA